MKRISILLFVFISCFLTAKAALQSIPLKYQSIMSLEWYEEQTTVWQEKVKENPMDADSWFNLYTASRYAKKSQEELDAIVEKMDNAVPASFEFNFVKAWNTGYNEEALNNLEIAYRKNPDNPLTYGSFMVFYELLRNKEKKKEFAGKLFDSRYLSKSLLNYSYNVLMSVEQDGILFTQGDNSTIPLWVMQEALDIRPDVRIFNIDLLVQDAYLRQMLLEESLNYSEPGFDLSADVTPKALAALLRTLPQQNPERKFYYALTLSNDEISSIRDNLYVVGLASQISTESIDNIAIIKKNLEKRFLVDYLKVNFDGESKNSTARVLSQNYLVPIILLNQHYQNSGEEEKAEEWTNLALQLSEDRGKLNEVSFYLYNIEPEQTIFPPYELDTKELEKSFNKVKDNLYASAFEVTNKSYNDFLQYLRENQLSELLEVCDIDLSGYEEPALSLMKSYHLEYPDKMKRVQKFDNYPVINISYEAVQKYCEWLTSQYNNSPDRSYQKVVFRLPSLKEWQIAALGYKDFTSWDINENIVQAKPTETDKDRDKQTYDLSNYDVLYPWWNVFSYRDKAKNRFGCYLGNFKVPDTVSCASGIPGDAWLMAGAVGSYFPNGMGLYDVVGNVAEMINEKGKACGGSWNHVPESSTIKSINDYDGADASTGFRIFMEVVKD